MAKITINDVDVDVPDGTSVIAAADQAGVPIPRFCYHPDLRPAGNCRICQVEIEGVPRLQVSCMTPVKDGMVVRTDTPKVKKAVQGDLEFLLLNHPVDCPICDQAGECYLQDFYMQVGQHESRIPLPAKVRKRKVVDLGDQIVLDSERCVMCSRCIRFSDEVSGTHQFGFFQRGSKMEIGTYRDRPLEDPYSGNYADVCPVGALTSKDFRFSSRVWFLQRTDSVCPHCSTGCNIRVDHKDEQVHRFVPRRNAAVNQSWMCDRGRMTYKELGTGRLLAPRMRQDGQLQEVTWDQALERVGAALAAARAEPGTIAGIASPGATCEELWAFRGLMQALGSSNLDYRVTTTWAQVDEREDALLRRADHHPNSRGAELLGMVPGPGGLDLDGMLARAAQGGLQVLYLQGPELLSRADLESVRKACAGVALVVVQDTHERTAHELADVVLPIASFAELDGSFVNYGYRLQRIWRAVACPGQARASLQILADLQSRSTGELPAGDAKEVFAAIAKELPAFAGLDFERIGPLGRTLEVDAPGVREAG